MTSEIMKQIKLRHGLMKQIKLRYDLMKQKSNQLENSLSVFPIHLEERRNFLKQFDALQVKYS
jgi:hypothetical protein